MGWHDATTPDDIRRMLAEDRFGDLIDGQVVAIPHGEKLIRALALAAEYGFLELVQELAREGADLKLAADALIAAAEGEQLEVLRFLITVGVPVDARCQMFGASALMHAAGSGAAKSVQMLLKSGADPHAVDREGKTARGWAEMGVNSGHWQQIPMPPELNAGFSAVLAALATA
jgi:ankyrin repeat protein